MKRALRPAVILSVETSADGGADLDVEIDGRVNRLHVNASCFEMLADSLPALRDGRLHAVRKKD